MPDNAISMADRPWRQRLAELALACAGSFAADEAARIGEACELLAHAPDRALLAGLAPPAPVVVKALLAAGAPESAALALFGGGAGYMLSRGGDGQHLASVVLPGRGEEVTAGGDTLALALIGALALALAEAEDSPGREIARPIDARAVDTRTYDGARPN